jgi:uncharacterized membrane protein YhaH (DUF805 family)
MFCSNCGTQVNEGVNFCLKCGNPVAQGQPHQQPQPQQPNPYAPPRQDVHQQTVPVADKNPWQYFTGAFKKYAVFSGRARRAEFWYFYLFDAIFVITLSVLELSLLGTQVIAAVWNLATMIPSIALAVRRMHDCDKAGPYCLIPIYGWIVLPCTEGTKGPNRFGHNPKLTN